MSLECVVNKATSTGEEASQHPCRRNQSKPKHASSKQVEYTHTHTHAAKHSAASHSQSAANVGARNKRLVLANESGERVAGRMRGRRRPC